MAAPQRAPDAATHLNETGRPKLRAILSGQSSLESDDFETMKVSEYRAHLSNIVGGGKAVQVTKQGTTAGYWVPADDIESLDTRQKSQTEAYARMQLILSTLASVMDPDDIQEELSDLAALREAEGVIE